MGIREVMFPMFPIGLSYIAGALRGRHEVRIFDPNAYELARAPEELRQEVLGFRPDIVGLSIRNIDTTNLRQLHVHFNTVRPTLQAIKGVDPKIRTIAGGAGFSIFAQQIMERVPELDYGIYLEGEESIVELLANLDTPENVKGVYFRKDERVQFSGPRPFVDFAALSMPCMDADVIDMKKYLGPSYNIIGIQTKRGCVLECTYCSYLFLNGKRVRLREPRHVVDQIEYMVKNFGMEHFNFVDSIFNIPESHAIEICRELIKRKLNVRWGAWCHVKNISREFLELAKEAGAIQIDFSPDAITERGLKALRKNITVEDVRKSLEVSRQVKGMGIGYNFFCSFPGMKAVDFAKTASMLFRIPLLLPGRGGVGMSWMRIEPHTELYETALREGTVSKDLDLIPEDGRALKKLFYTPASQWYAHAIMHSLLTLIERVLKPSALIVFRVLSRLRGKKSLYDSKAGFMRTAKK